MKKLLTIILIIVLILCGIKFLTSCGNEYNGVEYDYDGVSALKKAIDSNEALTNKKVFLKEYTIVGDVFGQTYIEFASNIKMSITTQDGDFYPAGTYSKPILVEITLDMNLLGNRTIIANIISE